MPTLEERIAELGIRATVREGAPPPTAAFGPSTAAFGPWATGWKVTLRMGRRQMTTPFYQDWARADPPTVGDVLECLLADAATIENAPEYKKWCRELDYTSADWPQSWDLWQQCKRQTERLRRFLGEHYETLLWETEH